MATSGSIIPLLRKAAPRLTRHFFSHHGCASSTSSSASLRQSRLPTSSSRSTRQTPFLQAFRSQTTASSPPSTNLGSLGHVLSNQARASPLNPSTTKRSSYFPPHTPKYIAYWLFGSAASVYGIVVFGGLTRLTESGLSITEWRPVTGTLPPLSQPAWDREFGLYKSSPEFQQLNPNMTLPEFKQIYWMEYTHRLWGRVIGLTFLLPTIYFVARRRVSAPIARNLLLINALIATQGAVGWWMVKSGLKDDLFAKGQTPRVSQYRLMVHLGLAFAVYSGMLWNGLQVLREWHFLREAQPERAMAVVRRLASPALRPLRAGVIACGVLVPLTAMSGALVAGLDAGLIYNEFPYMGLGLTPPRSELWSRFYSRDKENYSDLWWRNLFENPSLVQLDHRILATSTFVAINALFFYARFSAPVRAALPKAARSALTHTLGFAWIQVALGISTLLYLVPVPLAAAHQAGALAVITGMVMLRARIGMTSRLTKLIQGRLANGTAREVRIRTQRLRRLEDRLGQLQKETSQIQSGARPILAAS